MSAAGAATRRPRRVLHILRGERARLACTPDPADRVVHLTDLDPTALVALVFEYDGVVVW